MSLPASKTPVKKRPPVMQVTRYDITRSFMVAIVLGLIIGVVWLAVMYVSQLPDKTDDSVDLELVEITGGYEDGEPDETLNVDSPEEETLDPSLADVESEQPEVEETLETVLDVADQATNQITEQSDTATENTGKVGSAKGTGGRPLGIGGGQGGVPAEQRWFIRFSDRGTLDTYARQLDFFGITLGLLTDKDLTYVSKLSQPNPTKRVVTTGKGEKRLYMTWQGGGRKAADVKLLRKAGVNGNNGGILHFYPARTEAMLLDLEKKYRNRKVQEIRRTYFIVNAKGDGFEFLVTRQTYLRGR